MDTAALVIGARYIAISEYTCVTYEGVVSVATGGTVNETVPDEASDPTL